MQNWKTMAPFTRDRINLRPVPDCVQIGLAFTRDRLEPVRCGSNFGPLFCERLGTDPIRSRSGPVPNLSGPV